ncbi:hypothetical protein B0H63DRAFT_560592 [Podospora didyma]|uniref:TPR repeat-containing protein n=1 Tax=Podospora didyma TaxID=330526 RepID=A0AAE0U0B9_9PEZI|nr:hypothetical protein B0H63DRAFT_560592 [Podospora didyma]
MKYPILALPVPENPEFFGREGTFWRMHEHLNNDSEGRCSSYKQWLLIFDNAEKWTDLIPEFWPQDGSVGAVIVTSRDSSIANSPATAREELQAFDADERIAFTQSILRDWDVGAEAVHHALGQLFSQLTLLSDAFPKQHHGDPLCESCPVCVLYILHTQALARTWRSAYFREVGDFEGALGLAETSLQACASSAAPVVAPGEKIRHQLVEAHLFNTLGVVKELKFEYSQARAVLEKCLEAHVEIFGPQSLEVSLVKENMASIMAAQGQYGAALKAYQSCLDLDPYAADIAEKNWFLTCGCHYKLAVIEMQLGNNEDALRHMNDAMALAQQIDKQGAGRSHHNNSFLEVETIESKIQAVRRDLEAQLQQQSSETSPDDTTGSKTLLSDAPDKDVFVYFIPWQARPEQEVERTIRGHLQPRVNNGYIGNMFIRVVANAKVNELEPSVGSMIIMPRKGGTMGLEPFEVQLTLGDAGMKKLRNNKELGLWMMKSNAPVVDSKEKEKKGFCGMGMGTDTDTEEATNE